jgi:16S rRNA (adenine1518-N6/adenine1519-N6)-dimethyltransferase
MKFSKKSLGQNFLNDKNIIKKIISSTYIKGRHVIEIGPGEAALTTEILNQKPESLTVIEKDNNLAKKLKIKFSNYKKIKVYNDDILKFNLEKILNENCIIFGNLPYNISSQILVKIIKFKNWPPKFTDLILMFQKELAEKITGKHLTKNYGRLSILTNYRLNVLKKFTVSPNCFFPKPKVTSMVIHFKPKIQNLYNIKKIDMLEKITNIFFSNKRKMINKNIVKLLKEKEINKISDLKMNLRPADLKPETYFKITEIYEKK